MINGRVLLLVAATAVFFILVLYARHTYSEAERVKAENDRLVIELQHVKGEVEAIRSQYDVINAVLFDNERKRQAAEKEVGDLQRKLEDAQKNEPCAQQRVPDAVTQRLRERVAAVNAAVDTK